MVTVPRWVYSIGHGSSADTVDDLLRVLFNDAQTALDVTYGSGKFWGATPRVAVTGVDLDPVRARDGVEDFRHLSYADGSHDVVIFDPPFQADAGRDAIMGTRFGSYDSVEEMEAAVRAGVREALRVARLGAIVKVQNHVHGQVFVHMTDWVITEARALGLGLYDERHVEVKGKVRSRRWYRQLSVWRTHATYLVFRKDGPAHRPRTRPAGKGDGMAPVRLSGGRRAARTAPVDVEREVAI